MTVSRGTTPEPPQLAQEIFANQLPSMVDYARILSGDGVQRGLIGPREVDRIWERHLINCAVAAERVDRNERVCDIGTGAGLPGMVWAIMRPDLDVVLVDPLLRRITFLEEVVAALDLANVRVIRGRAEEVGETFPVVTARAVARMDKLARLTLPLVDKGGVLLAFKGQSAENELAESRTVLSNLGVTNAKVTAYGYTDIPTRVIEVSR